MPYENRSGNRARSGSRQQQGGESKMRSTPTENMLSYAERIADALDMDLPEGVAESFDACREFIDEYAEKVPPTDKQVKFAETLAKDAGETIPRNVLKSKVLLSRWIDEHSGNAE